MERPGEHGHSGAGGRVVRAVALEKADCRPQAGLAVPLVVPLRSPELLFSRVEVDAVEQRLEEALVLLLGQRELPESAFPLAEGGCGGVRAGGRGGAESEAVVAGGAGPGRWRGVARAGWRCGAVCGFGGGGEGLESFDTSGEDVELPVGEGEVCSYGLKGLFGGGLEALLSLIGLAQPLVDGGQCLADLVSLCRDGDDQVVEGAAQAAEALLEGRFSDVASGLGGGVGGEEPFEGCLAVGLVVVRPEGGEGGFPPGEGGASGLPVSVAAPSVLVR